MKIDIRRYLSLRDSLVKEKAQLETRLEEINKALAEDASVPAGPVAMSTPTAAPAPSGRRGRRGRGGLSLREAVLQVTSSAPLTKEQILDRVQALGYRFSTKNPMNSLGVILYGRNPRFRNEGGRFSPLGGRPAGGGAATKAAKPPAKKTRTLSPEARARIAAAQRARWAKQKRK